MHFWDCDAANLRFARQRCKCIFFALFGMAFAVDLTGTRFVCRLHTPSNHRANLRQFLGKKFFKKFKKYLHERFLFRIFVTSERLIENGARIRG